jgi:tetratricopeptide (TPR) repeat protein
MEAALAAADWSRAGEVLAAMQRLDPAGQNAARWAYALHQRQAEVLVEADQLQASLDAWDRAIAARPMEASAYIQRQLVATYLEGKEHLTDGNWSAAVEALERAYAEAPDFKDVGSVLAQAHLAAGVAHQDAQSWNPARSEFERVLELVPGHAEATDRLAAVMRVLFPPQKVIVDISEQRMYVYENDVLIWNWPASTGEPGRGTAAGSFRILDKIPMAYASTWSLHMPYWMGIYWVGNIENGIHGPPTNRYGQVMWEGYIGRPVSYGCVILSSANVRTLYDWIEIGTPVIIRH